MRFAGRSVIVTGGAAGIGAATARLFAGEGAKVVIADLDPAGEALARELRGQGRDATFVRTDAADASDAEALVAETVRRHGRLDVLHNNAGVLVIGDVTTLSEADWDRCIDVNLKSVFLVSKHAVPAMRAAGGGAIVNTASVAGKAGGRGYSVYCASKAGILLLTQCMALDFAADRIRVNAVCPGPTATAMVLGRTNAPERERARWANELPAGRIGEPEDAAKVVAYLASDDASFVTGAAWVVDGGRLLTGIGQSTVHRP
jgi:meso-butanediol dehydrogenase / (S,S)-butanediol dehydrogenase / diacetyl reductase